MSAVSTSKHLALNSCSGSDAPMHAQTSENEFVTAFRSQLKWLVGNNEMNRFVIYNPVRPIVFEYNRTKMARYVAKVLDERFSAHAKNEPRRSKKRTQPIIDLALDAYREENGNRSTNSLDATFKRFAVDQIKNFMFGGHDTTSSTFCYVVHSLSKHPDALRKLRHEHDDVLGTDVSKTTDAIKEDPYLLNNLPYTVAITKEVLRMYTPASTVRMGQSGFFLHHDGKQYATEGEVTACFSASHEL